MKYFVAPVYVALVFFLASCSAPAALQRQVSDEELLEFVYNQHTLPYSEAVSFESYRSSVQLQRAEWDVNQNGDHEIVFSVDFSMPNVTYIFVVSPQDDSLRELFFSKKYGWYDLNGRFIWQDGSLLLNYLSKGGGSNTRVSNWEQEVVRCNTDACSSFSYSKYSWGFSFGLYGEDPTTSVSIAKTQFAGNDVTVREYQYRDAGYTLTNRCYDKSGEKWFVSQSKNAITQGPTRVIQYRWNGTEFIQVLEKEETPAVSYEEYAAGKSNSIFKQSLSVLHDHWEDGEISEEQIEQEYLRFFDISPAGDPVCGEATALSIASAYDDHGLNAEIVHATDGCRLKVWNSPDWDNIQTLAEIKTVGVFDFACTADFTRLLWQDIDADEIKELFVVTQDGFDETVHIFQAGDTLQTIGTLTGFLREPNFRGIEWQWREGRFFLLAGKPFWKLETCRDTLDCYDAIDQPVDVYFWDPSAQQFTYTYCDFSVPSVDFMNCHSAMTKQFNALLTMAAQTITSEILSATPTAAPTATPTTAPTRTPIPTSPVWRVEPIATAVTAPVEPLDIFGVDDLPSFGMGRQWTAFSFDEDFDGQPDRSLYTQLSNEQQETWHQSLLELLKERGDTPDVDTAGFAVLDTLDIDLDRDGKREIVFTYHLGRNPYLVFGIAVMRNDQLLDSTPLDWRGDYEHDARLIGVPLSESQTALLAHLTTATGGSGIYPRIYRRLLLLEDDKLRIVWDWEYGGGARAGAAYRQFANEKIEFSHVSGGPYADILLSRTAEGLFLPDNPRNFANYRVQFPGEIVFSWDGEKYVLSHYYDGKSLTPIPPADFILHAPRIDASLCAGSFQEDCLLQIEYRDSLPAGYGWGNEGRSVEGLTSGLAWDEHSLYMNVSVFPLGPKIKHSTIWIGLDTDLQTDYKDHALNADDRLLKIEIEDPAHCDKDLSVQLIHPHIQSIPFKNHSQLDACEVSLVIPLDMLGLDIPAPEQPGKILKFTSDQTLPFHQYFPQAGKAIGFAVFSENTEEEKATALRVRQWLRLLPFDPQDPITWGTLIFMSDR